MEGQPKPSFLKTPSKIGRLCSGTKSDDPVGENEGTVQVDDSERKLAQQSLDYKDSAELTLKFTDFQMKIEKFSKKFLEEKKDLASQLAEGETIMGSDIQVSNQKNLEKLNELEIEKGKLKLLCKLHEKIQSIIFESAEPIENKLNRKLKELEESKEASKKLEKDLNEELIDQMDRTERMQKHNDEAQDKLDVVCEEGLEKHTKQLCELERQISYQKGFKIELLEGMEAKKAENQKLIEQIKDLTSTLKDLTEENKTLSERNTKNENENELLKVEVNKKDTLLSQLKGEYKKQNKLVTKYTQISETIKDLETKLQDKTRELEQKDQELKPLISKIWSLEANVAEKTNEVTNLEIKVQNQSNEISRLKKAEEEVVRLKSELIKKDEINKADVSKNLAEIKKLEDNIKLREVEVCDLKTSLDTQALEFLNYKTSSENIESSLKMEISEKNNALDIFKTQIKESGDKLKALSLNNHEIYMELGYANRKLEILRLGNYTFMNTWLDSSAELSKLNKELKDKSNKFDELNLKINQLVRDRRNKEQELLISLQESNEKLMKDYENLSNISSEEKKSIEMTKVKKLSAPKLFDAHNTEDCSIQSSDSPSPLQDRQIDDDLSLDTMQWGVTVESQMER